MKGIPLKVSPWAYSEFTVSVEQTVFVHDCRLTFVTCSKTVQNGKDVIDMAIHMFATLCSTLGNYRPVSREMMYLVASVHPFIHLSVNALTAEPLAAVDIKGSALPFTSLRCLFVCL